MRYRSKRRKLILGAGIAAALLLGLAGLAAFDLSRVQPARSERLSAWEKSGAPTRERGAALFSFGDFGALDLDTLGTSAMPWPLLAASLALQEAHGNPDAVGWAGVEIAFRRFGFLYPTRISDLTHTPPITGYPLGLSVGTVTRLLPPLEVEVLNIGCTACHAGPAYRGDGSGDPSAAVAGMPNTSIDLEAFSTATYAAFKQTLYDEPKLLAAVGRLFPDMGWRASATLRFVILPMARAEIEKRRKTYDRPLPFRNGAPGLTNGVGALAHQLAVTADNVFNGDAGFVSVPVIADRFWRSSLLVDGAYAPKGEPRFVSVTRKDLDKREPARLAAIVSFFMVPSMGMSDRRVAAAIPELTAVAAHLRTLEPPHFPGAIDRASAQVGQTVYGRACANCHGRYDDSLERPRLLEYPNWAGDVGTDRSRVEAFTDELVKAVGRTWHGKTYLDAERTGRTVAPLLTGLWASAPYFTNGSVPTIRHLLEPETRPVRFQVGGHGLDMKRLGIAGVAVADRGWTYPAGYVPFSRPVVVDTTQPGFSNRGHEKELGGLTAADRDALIEYLKLL